MRRKSLIAVLAAIMVMASSALSFAAEGGLELVSSYPEDGQKNTSIENLGVQLHFSGTFTSEDVIAANKELVKIVDSEGEAVEITVLFSEDEEGLVLVVADDSASSSEEYSLIIDAQFSDDEGNTLGEETVISFTTYNQKLNGIVNFVIMMAIFGGMMIITIKQQRDQLKDKSKDEANANGAFNPYKEAKRTGKSVEEVKAEEAKRQAKLAKKNKKNKTPEKLPSKIANCAELLNNVYHVHAPRPIRQKAASPETKAKKSKGAKK